MCVKGWNEKEKEKDGEEKGEEEKRKKRGPEGETGDGGGREGGGGELACYMLVKCQAATWMFGSVEVRQITSSSTNRA